MSKKLNGSNSEIYNHGGFPKKQYGIIVNISGEALLFFLGVMVSISIEQFTEISDYVVDCSQLSSYICFMLKDLQFICSIGIDFCMYKLYRFVSELHAYTLKTKLEEERDNAIFCRLYVIAKIDDKDDVEIKVKKIARKIHINTVLVFALVICILIMIFTYITNGLVVNFL